MREGRGERQREKNLLLFASFLCKIEFENFQCFNEFLVVFGGLGEGEAAREEPCGKK